MKDFKPVIHNFHNMTISEMKQISIQLTNPQLGRKYLRSIIKELY